MPKRKQPELPVIAQARKAANVAQRVIRSIEASGVPYPAIESLLWEHFGSARTITNAQGFVSLAKAEHEGLKARTETPVSPV